MRTKPHIRIGRITANYRAVVFVAALVDFVFGATFVYHMTAIGVQPAAIGALLAVVGIVTLALEVPTGILADRIGHKRVLVIGLTMWAGGQALFGLSTSVPSVAAALLLLNAAQACYSGSPISYTINALNRMGGGDHVARVSASGVSWRWVGAAAGGATVFLLGDRVGTGLTLTITGVAMLIAAGWVALAWPPEAIESSDDLSTHIRSASAAGFRFVVARSSRNLVATLCALAFGQGIVSLAWQPSVLEFSVVSASTLGLVLVVLAVAAAAGSYLASRLVGSVVRWALVASLGVLAAGLGVASLHGVASIAGLLLAEFGLGASGALLAAMQQRMFSDALRNTLTSTVAAIFTVMVGAGQMVGGAVWGSKGVGASLLVGAGVVAILTVAVAVSGAPRRDTVVASEEGIEASADG